MARPSSRRPNRFRSKPADTDTATPADRRVVDTVRRRPGRRTRDDDGISTGTGGARGVDEDFWSQPPDFPDYYGRDDASRRYEESLRSRARSEPAFDADPVDRQPERWFGRRGGRRLSRAARRSGRGSGSGRSEVAERGSRARDKGSGRSKGGAKGLAGSLPGSFSARLPVSDATVARVGAAVLWALVILAAYGGITAWMGSGKSSSAEVAVPAPGDVPDGRWAAAGFAERYVAAYLTAGSDGSALAPYLGYSPELPPIAEPATMIGAIRTVEVVRADGNRPDYWSVTVAVGNPAGGAGPTDPGPSGQEDAAGAAGSEAFWQVGVDTSGDQPVAVGLPAPVAGPPDPAKMPVAATLSQPSPDDPAVESVEGFLAAYLCGAADLDRYLHPEAALTAADPPLCQQVEVVRWGVADPAASSEEQRQTVVAEVVFDSGDQARRATYGLTLAQRDGRWEVAELLPAPPIKER